MAIPLSVIRGELQAAGLSFEATPGGLLLTGPKETLAQLLPTSSPALPPLTGQQRKALDAIRRLTVQTGLPPAVREIGKEMGLTSSATVHMHLLALNDKGYIEYGGGPRRLRLLA